MISQFDSQFPNLKDMLLVTGGMVEQGLASIEKAWAAKEAKYFDLVYSLESQINAKHIEIDQECLRILATSSPLASDLRMIHAVIKMNTDLERMGDQCVNLSLTSTDFIKRLPTGSFLVAEQMVVEVKLMVSRALDSFSHLNAEGAQAVIAMDDKVDAMKNEVFRSLVEKIKVEPQQAEAYIDLILLARNLERIGDHATNIAENVIFIATGKDIRHGHFA